jgi:hypothetical protein
MFFNYDSFELGAIAFIVLGLVLYSITTTTLNNESLVNTNSSLDTSNHPATSQLIGVHLL